MRTKLKKLIFAVVKNSRITTKELSRSLKTSQQSASYLVSQLKKRKQIREYNTIIDSVRLGYTNIIVGFNFLVHESNVKREIISGLKEQNHIIYIEENKEGIDILVEYCVPNLSSFNKAHMEIIHAYHKKLRSKFILPVIVKHKFQKNYLVRKGDDKDIILCGDRNIVQLSETERKALVHMAKEASIKMVSLAQKLQTTAKTAANIKKSLEKKNVIKGYSCILGHNKLGIMRHNIFLEFTSEGVTDIDKFIQYSRQNKNIAEVTKLIGDYHVLLTIEELKSSEILQEIRSMFPIDGYLVAKSEIIHKKTFMPAED